MHLVLVTSTNFARKLFTSLVACGDSVDSTTWDKAIDDLAEIDAHSSRVARSTHHDVSDSLGGGVIKKSLRAFQSVMKRLPVDFPPERSGDDEFDNLIVDRQMTFVEERSVECRGARPWLARSGRFLPPGLLRADKLITCLLCVHRSLPFFDEPVAYFSLM